MSDPSLNEVLTVVSPPVGAVLTALASTPRTPDWLAHNLGANRERMARLALPMIALVEGEMGWFGKLKLWRLTPKGEVYWRVWSAEMARREEVSSKRGVSWAPGEEPQEGDEVIEYKTGVAGMRAAVRVVPHNRRAVDVPYEPPADMVSALGLLNEHEAASLQYLVGANAFDGATDERMEAIMVSLEGQGCAVRQGHGWARTPMGTRWHQTWTHAPGSQTE